MAIGYINAVNSPLSAYPIGSIYMSVNNIDPGALFGGVWQKLEDKFLIGASNTYQAGSTGGSANHTPSGTLSGGSVGSHTLTIEEIPSHSHTIKGTNVGTSGGDYNAMHADGGYQSGYGTTVTGGGQGHTHPYTAPTFSGTLQDTMPPYLAVYMWKRIA